METSYDIIVLGDINLDILVREFPYSFAEAAAQEITTPGELTELPGGGAFNLAYYAKQIGYKPLLLSRIGTDQAGEILIKWLEQNGLATNIIHDILNATGQTMVIYDKNKHRLMVTNIPNANHYLTLDEIETALPNLLPSCKMLYISGYCFLERQHPRFGAAQGAIEIASKAHPKPLILMDVVPHDLNTRYSLSEFYELSRDIDILISGVSTMRRFLRLGTSDEIVSETVAIETLDPLISHYERIILRYGRNGSNYQIIWDGVTGIIVKETTDMMNYITTRGYGDYLTMNTLKNVFKL